MQKSLFDVFAVIMMAVFLITGCGGGGGTSASGLTARDDAYQTLEDNSITVDAPGVLANDSGEVGEILVVGGFDATSLNGGTVAMTTDGGFTYTPPADFLGADSFSYTVTGVGGQSTALVQVTVEQVPSFLEIQKRLASDAEAGDTLGDSVSISGDYAIVGATRENSWRGAAYVYHRNEGGADMWGVVAKLTASDAEDFDEFGCSVSISGDYAIVGARVEGSGGSYAGAAYVYHRNEGGEDMWGEVTKLTASDAEADDKFGSAVSISGDYAIVGAYVEDSGGGDAGAVYVLQKE